MVLRRENVPTLLCNMNFTDYEMQAVKNCTTYGTAKKNTPILTVIFKM